MRSSHPPPRPRFHRGPCLPSSASPPSRARPLAALLRRLFNTRPPEVARSPASPSTPTARASLSTLGRRHRKRLFPPRFHPAPRRLDYSRRLLHPQLWPTSSLPLPPSARLDAPKKRRTSRSLPRPRQSTCRLHPYPPRQSRPYQKSTWRPSSTAAPGLSATGPPPPPRTPYQQPLPWCRRPACN